MLFSIFNEKTANKKARYLTPSNTWLLSLHALVLRNDFFLVVRTAIFANSVRHH